MSLLPLEKLAVIERGRFSARPRNDPQYYGGEIPFIQTGDVANSSGVVQSFDQTLNEKGLGVSKLFPAQSLVISIAANIGDVASVDFDFACPDSLVVIQARDGVSQAWLKYLLMSKKRYFLSRATQNAQANINLETIKPLKVQVPPLAEQERIVEILSDADAAITTAEKSQEKHETQFIGLIHSLFDNEKKSSWQETTIGNLGRVVSGGTPASGKSSYWNGDVNWATPTDITGLSTRHIGSTEKTISQAGLANSSATLLPKNSLLVCTRATVGDCAINIEKMCTNQGFKNIIPKENIDIDFLYFLILSEKREIVRRSAGSTFLEISGSEFSSIPIRIPNQNAQISIAKALADAAKLTEETRCLISTLKKQKRGLLQQLLTGKLRVQEKV